MTERLHMLTPGELDASPWASCGPAALAALLHRPLADIRHAMPIHHPAQLQRTHWIAVSPILSVDCQPYIAPLSMVFDVNLVDGLDASMPLLPVSHGWTTREAWELGVVPALAKSYGKKSTGAWWVRAGIEVVA